MDLSEIQNANPTILSAAQLPSRRQRKPAASSRGPECKYDDILSAKQSAAPWDSQHNISPWPSDSDHDDDGGGLTEEPIDEQEIYDLISTISDPEHPLTLGQLSVVNLPDIHLSPPPLAESDPNTLTQVVVEITPTINHCSLVTVIGLAVRTRLERTLPPSFRIVVRVKEGTHATGDGFTKQLGDKERAAAALENDSLRTVVNDMLKTCK